jgi:hypothetical protein
LDPGRVACDIPDAGRRTAPVAEEALDVVLRGVNDERGAARDIEGDREDDPPPKLLRGAPKLLRGALKLLRGALKLLRGALKLLRGALKLLRGALKLLRGALKLLRGMLLCDMPPKLPCDIV